MAKVLGQIAERLKTDLGELARATVDPSFSRLRDLSNFENKQHERNRREALEDARVLQAQNKAAEDEKARTAIHMKLFEDSYTAFKQSGGREAGGMIRLLDQEGISPIAREFGILALKTRPGPSYEDLSARINVQKGLQGMKNDEIKINIEQGKYRDEQLALVNDVIDKQWERDYEVAKNMLNQQQHVLNRNGLIKHIRNSKGVFTDAEVEETVSAMTEADDKTARIIYNRAWDTANAHKKAIDAVGGDDRAGVEEDWIDDDGVIIGVKQQDKTGKYQYKRYKDSPLIDMSSGAKIKFSMKEFEEASTQANAAEGQIQNLDYIDAVLRGIDTGSLTDLKVSLGQLSASLNLPIDEDISKLEGARTASGNLVMAMLNNFPGQISNAEREFLEARMPGLTQTKAGREAISVMLRRGAERALAKRDIMSKYIRGKIPDLAPEEGQTFYEEWDQYKEDNPLFSDLQAPTGQKAVDDVTGIVYFESLDGKFRDANGAIFGAAQ